MSNRPDKLRPRGPKGFPAGLLGSLHRLMLLVTGATGYVGSALTQELLDRGERVRTLSRRGAGAGEAMRGDALSGQGLPEALDGFETAYYLVHSMGAGGDFSARDRQGAVNFGEAA